MEQFRDRRSSGNIGLYLSFPFSSHPVLDLLWGSHKFELKTTAKYLTSLSSEIENSRKSAGRRISSLLLGGGDWALADVKSLSMVFSLLKSKFTLARSCEVTTEVALESSLKPRVALLGKLGVNRISFNCFSFSASRLQQATAFARDCGIKNINADLYFGKPRQSVALWQHELKESVSLKIPHLSLYSHSSGKKPSHPKNEMYLSALDFLSKKGYRQYEICHFAKSGRKSRQNLHYWKRKNYLGFGLGASSLWNNVRWQNTSSLASYLKQATSSHPATKLRERLGARDLEAEEIYFALRQPAGLDLRKFIMKFGEDFLRTRQVWIKKLCQKGYARLSPSRIQLTKEGFLQADDIIKRII